MTIKPSFDLGILARASIALKEFDGELQKNPAYVPAVELSSARVCCLTHYMEDLSWLADSLAGEMDKLILTCERLLSSDFDDLFEEGH